MTTNRTSQAVSKCCGAEVDEQILYWCEKCKEQCTPATNNTQGERVKLPYEWLIRQKANAMRWEEAKKDKKYAYAIAVQEYQQFISLWISERPHDPVPREFVERLLSLQEKFESLPSSLLKFP